MDNLLARLTEWTGTVSGYAWGIPSIVLLVGTGLYLTIRLRFIQIRGFKHSWQVIRGKYDKPVDPGEVTHFQALSTALSATVGTGNIAGVATAIAFGGPGAVFWMWITALVGMATKFASCSLALKFRRFHPDGSVSGGPMYTLLYGLNFKTLAVLFAAFTLIASFGIGNMVQANSVVDGLAYVFPGIIDYRLGIGVIIAILVGLVIIGGIKRIARVTSRIVPFMAVFYCGAALLVLFLNLDKIPGAFATIFNLALNPWAAGGGAIGAAIQYGVARGVFSNEAGLGSAPMAHAAARTSEPAREGLVAMMGPFIDTIVICTMTALVIVIMGAWGDARPDGLEGAALSAYAFEQGLGTIGSWVVGIGLVFFAYSTMIAWSYYGDRSAEFLFGERAVMPYRIVFTVLVVVGAYVPLQLVWNFADIANILMAAPNLISLILLAGLAKKVSDDYFSRMPG
ncbi:MAG: sodium:alanine symporter family protein [Thiohalophilus sp.]|nr:sodium:alanine symporter family protein [Thiohalophilus sp.]MDR9437340.1 sodium:alanine symporter family protein [Thiohalophilus sp.]